MVDDVAWRVNTLGDQIAIEAIHRYGPGFDFDYFFFAVSRDVAEDLQRAAHKLGADRTWEVGDGSHYAGAEFHMGSAPVGLLNAVRHEEGLNLNGYFWEYDEDRTQEPSSFYGVTVPVADLPQFRQALADAAAEATA
jgi:hypothetical protein